MKRSSIGTMSLTGSAAGWPFAGQDFGIGDQIAMERRGQFHGDLHGLVVGDRAEFQLRHGQPPVGFEHKVAGDDDRTGKPGRMVSVGATLSWRRTICWPASLMVSCAPLRMARISRSSSLTPARRRPSSVERPAALANPTNDNRRHPQARHSPGVRAGLALQNDGAAVRQDEAVPDEQHAALAELHVVVILADDPRALRDQQMRPVGLS
jgi:hypothetical protein